MSEDYNEFLESDTPILEDVSDHETPEDDEDNTSPVQEPKEEERESKESYSKRVQKRIDLLAYERNIERDRVAKLEAEIEELKRHREKEVVAQTAQEIDAQRKELLQKKKDALEVGDYDAVVDLDEKLIDLKTQKQPSFDENGKYGKPEVQQQPQPIIPKAMADWEAKNQWVYEQSNKEKVDKANALLEVLRLDGYELDDPDTYAELDRRLTKQRIIPPPTGAPDRGQLSGGSKDTQFTAKDKQLMRDWGLDPDNAKHRAEWIKNRSKA
jgi:hypothetical protein